MTQALAGKKTAIADQAANASDADLAWRDEIARQFHDGMLQLMAAARLKVGMIRRQLDVGAVSAESASIAIREVERLLDGAMAEAQKLSAELKAGPRTGVRTSVTPDGRRSI